MKQLDGIRRTFAAAALLVAGVMASSAQQVLTLQDCRNLALASNRQSAIAREKVNAASYDRKAARSNYFPKVSMTAAYLHNGDQLHLLDDGTVASLSGLGTNLGSRIGEYVTGLMSNPEFLQVLAVDPGMQFLLKQASSADIAGPLNAIGQSVADKFTFDITNVYVGAVSVEEPVYAGGKIRAYNKVTAYAEELAATQLETEDRNVLVTTDEAYWQIVSIAWKLKLAEQYVDLLKKLESDVEIMKNEGVATAADLLSVRVSLNDAEMTKMKAENGLVLSKMLLCQLCGLDLYSDIVLKEEQDEAFLIPESELQFTSEDIDSHRPELRSLTLASKMYEQKVRIVQADYLPAVALTGNYLLTNPNLKNGVEKKFRGMWSVGVVARIPVFHFGEGMNKVRHAKSDALIAQYQLEEAREKISLQVTQNEQRIVEADSRLQAARRNLENAEENLRMSNVGFQEGVLESSVVMKAQTAWMKAHSEEIDARIDRIMADVYLRQATGLWNE